MSNILRFGSSWHASIPNEFIRCPKLSDGAFRLFAVIISYASPSSPQPFPTWETLAHSVRCCRNSVAKWLKELEDGGWISREQQPGKFGQFGHNIYTIYPDDEVSCQKRKQFLSPSIISRDTAAPHTARRDTVKCDTKITTDQDHQKKKKTTTTRAENGSGGLVSISVASPPKSFPNGREHELAQSFLKRWNDTFQKWYGVAYQEAYGDVVQVQKLFQTFPEARPRDFLYLVFQMWLDTREKDGIVEKDPLFYSYKGQRNLNFFCRHVLRIAEEQDDTIENVIGRITAKELEALEEAVVAGRN